MRSLHHPHPVSDHPGGDGRGAQDGVYTRAGHSISRSRRDSHRGTYIVHRLIFCNLIGEEGGDSGGITYTLSVSLTFCLSLDLSPLSIYLSLYLSLYLSSLSRSLSLLDLSLSLDLSISLFVFCMSKKFFIGTSFMPYCRHAGISIPVYLEKWFL